MTKLDRILLVDDSRADNFLHKTILTKAQICEQVDIAMGGQEALDYLSTPVNGVYPQPQIIFLDINMPGMNGWEFLEHYEQLPPEQKGEQIVVMLTTSLNPDDRQRAEQIESISYFENKPLLEQKIHSIVAQFFGA
ncbi:response regulator [Luteibaculum oceani]|uniref:Response regulator n=2 Tax=Luteibaculum oceani TaxID=1294296 RepID=A0A5C6V1B7_9FLAO|nr:response regulator [Luteibaculum oceani]